MNLKNVLQNFGKTKLFDQAPKVICAGDDLKEELVKFTNFVTDKDGEFIVRSAEEIRNYHPEVISGFCVQYGIYGFPTLELLDFLKQHIDSDRVLEIGAGRGIISRELKILATDSCDQKKEHIKEAYEFMMQAPVVYGDHVLRIEALEAVRKYKPDVVIASWVTHNYNPREHYNGGKKEGVKEEKILEKVKKYILIGNDSVNPMRPILSKSHESYKFPWLVARSFDQSLNSIWIWKGEKR